MKIVNATIACNYADKKGSGIYLVDGTEMDLKNTIVLGNLSTVGNELSVCAICTANIDHSLYGNATGDVFITIGGAVNATNSLHDAPSSFYRLQLQNKVHPILQALT